MTEASKMSKALYIWLDYSVQGCEAPAGGADKVISTGVPPGTSISTNRAPLASQRDWEAAATGCAAMRYRPGVSALKVKRD
jgi:hypothetical protein